MNTKLSLDQLKNAFSQKTTSSENSDWKKFFSFWKMEPDTQVTVRFLPDLDEDNALGFLVENLSHELVINGDRKKVPCLQMYGEACPICEESKRHYDEKNEEMGKKYYKKKSYIGQVLVIECPFEYDQEPIVKLIDFGPKIFKAIQAAFQSGDLEEVPYNLVGGYNFRIKKTKSGQYADYATSSFSPKQTDVSDEVLSQVELYDLKEYRTKHIDRVTLEAMLLADKTGASFDSSNDEVQSEKISEVKHETKVVNKQIVEQERTEVPTEKPPISNKAQQVLERLRNSAAKKAE